MSTVELGCGDAVEFRFNVQIKQCGVSVRVSAGVDHVADGAPEEEAVYTPALVGQRVDDLLLRRRSLPPTWG